MLKRLLIIIIAGVFFASCAAKKDIIKSMQEEIPTTVMVSTAPLDQDVTREKSIETSLSASSNIGLVNVAYKKYSDIPGIDWKKQVRFSFKDEDIGKLFEFLSKASGLTIVNTGAEVAVDTIKDPQSITAQQQLMSRQMYYNNNQQEKAKADITKKIGPATGNVTVYSKGQVTLEQAFKILDSVLMGKGYTSLFVGEVLKVVPISGIKQLNIPVVVNNDPALSSEGDEIVSQIVLLKNLTAEKLRTDLAALTPIWGMILSNDASNCIIIINSLSNIKSMLEIIDSLEKASTRSVGVSVFRLKYGDAKILSDVLNEVFRGVTSADAKKDVQSQQMYYGSRGLQAPQDTDKITIVDEIKSNSIIAVASPQSLALIKNTIEQLDQIQRQVLVEVLVVDVTLNGDFQMGVEWNIDSAPLDFAGRRLDNSSGVLNSNLQLAGKVPTFNYTLLKDNTKVFLHNLMKETKVDVKAAPRILTLDNTKATVNVGQEIPTLTGSQTTSGGQIIYTYNYNKVGTILEVTPHINQDDYVTLNLKQTVSKITETTYFGAPVLDNREATTSVRVKDGETMVLGGIITDSSSIIENKIPILGDIPILGFLFKSEQRLSEKTELMLFLTPHIINTSKEAGEAIKRMNKKIDNIKE
ncbi:MAG: secretin N-terminal domain-containing protein [Candidatus Firestonebacteria bacterium]